MRRGRGGCAIKTERVCRLALPSLRTCDGFVFSPLCSAASSCFLRPPWSSQVNPAPVEGTRRVHFVLDAKRYFVSSKRRIVAFMIPDTMLPCKCIFHMLWRTQGQRVEPRLPH